MKEPGYSPVTDIVRAGFHAYSGIGSIAGTICYFGGALTLFAQGDLCFLAVRILFVGPIVAPLVGILWPLLFITGIPTI